MLTTIRDEQGQILAACEWWLVTEQGRFSWEEGRYVRANHVAFSSGVDALRVMTQLIYAIADAAPNALGAYWQDRRNPGKPHYFHRAQKVKEEVIV